jgi:nucleoside-diphosphate-sugar epimerase
MIDNQGQVLVLGGAGFVGAYVVRRLLDCGERVLVYDAAPGGNSLTRVFGEYDAEQPSSRLTIERGTLTDAWRLLRTCERHGVDRIVHLASPLTQDVAEDASSGVRDICLGTAAVFEIARALRVRRVVWTSSVAVFGGRRDYPAGAIANDAPHRPDSLYGSCKSLCERMALDYRDRHDVDSIGLRLTVVYGPGRLRGYMSFPSELIRYAAAGLPLEVPLADVAMNWQYVEDVASCVVHALDVARPRDLVFNTSGEVRTFREAAEVLGGLAPGLDMTFLTEPRDDAERQLTEAPSQFDDALLREQLGWEPAFSLERGVSASFAAFARRSGDAAPQPEALL